MNSSDHRPETRPTQFSATRPAVRFSIHGAATPGVMSRVLDQFTRRGLVPDRWYSEATAGGIRIDLRIAGMDAAVARVLAATLRGTIDIHSVLSHDEPG